ncbi:MAG: hypothetical protein WA584_10460 [Pyrinomonadaceae bacterium]
MNKFRLAFQAFSLVGLSLVFSAIADAQATRTWVSGTGDDVNICSRAFPCATFTGALSKTSIGGEINCVDADNYGTVTINKSITIDCEDTQGTISATAISGITINLTDPADTAKTVRVRGLSINGFGTGTNGVKIVAATKVALEEVVIDGFGTHGVSILTTAGALSFVMKDSTVRNNVGNGINTFLTGAATATISVDGSLFAFNGVGFNQGVATTTSIQNSAMTNNTTGIQANGSTSILGVKDCVVSHNTTGVLAGSSATVRIGGNIITGNTTGLSGSAILTWDSNNLIDGNSGGNGLVTGFASAQ